MPDKPRTPNAKKGKRVCWILEQYINGFGWEPFYESDVNASREWAVESLATFSRKYNAEKFRVKKYERVGR